MMIRVMAAAAAFSMLLSGCNPTTADTTNVTTANTTSSTTVGTTQAPTETVGISTDNTTTESNVVTPGVTTGNTTENTTNSNTGTTGSTDTTTSVIGATKTSMPTGPAIDFEEDMSLDMEICPKSPQGAKPQEGTGLQVSCFIIFWS